MDVTNAAADLGRSGWCVLREALTPDQRRTLVAEVERLGRRAEAMLAGEPIEAARDATAELIVVPEASAPTQVCRYENIAGTSEVLAALFGGAIRDLVSSLCGEAMTLFKDKLNEKNPGGGAFPPHQDFTAYRHFGPRYNATAMIPIDDMTEENGCVQFAVDYLAAPAASGPQVIDTVEGRPLFAAHGPGRQNGDIVETASETFVWQPVTAKLGDIVVFDSFVPHFSLKNDSRERRRALFVTFSRAREGEWYRVYYDKKRSDGANPMFHVSTPTISAGS